MWHGYARTGLYGGDMANELVNKRVAALRPITSGGVSDEVEIRTGRVFLVREDCYRPGTQVALIHPDNAFDAYSKVQVDVEDLEVQV